MGITKSEIVAAGINLGFDIVRVAAAGACFPEAPRLHKWLSHGYAGDMAYLERNPPGRLDPRSLLPECQSVIVVALSYYQGEPNCDAPLLKNIARYAWGRDYHKVVRPRLKELGSLIDQRVEGHSWKATVDTSPILEKGFAVAAGIGWRGKNSLVLNEDLGSYFVIGLLLTSLELEPDAAVQDLCLGCKACLDACPSGALEAPRVLAANKCISYVTTESKTPLEPTADLQGWLFGCDICQEACPFNANLGTTNELYFHPSGSLRGMTLDKLIELDDQEFLDGFAGSAIYRRKRLRLQKQAENLMDTA